MKFPLIREILRAFIKNTARTHSLVVENKYLGYHFNMEDKEIIIGKYKIKVIRSECIGAASCVAVSPSTFELDGESKAIIKTDSTESEENILMAAQACPTKAIIVIDTETGKQIWPD